MRSAIEYVETLARALDNDDYESAATTMTPDVAYEIGGRILRGADEILTSYRESSEMAHRLFDDVRYDHEVIATDDPNAFRVSYSDILTVAGEILVHMAEQRVTVAPGEGVVGIVDVELPGEREKVDDFLARHGLSRDG